MIPGLSGTTQSVSFVDIITQFWDGVKCTFTDCRPYAALLLVGYCGVNVIFNTTGLFLTKRGGAVLNSLSFFLLLPINTFVFSAPFLGKKYREKFSWYTVGGLAVVLLGFVLYQRYNVFVDPGKEDGGEPLLSVADEESGGGDQQQRKRSSRTSQTSSSAAYTVPSSFQERIVGAGLAHRRPSISNQRSRGWSMGESDYVSPKTPAVRTPYGAITDNSAKSGDDGQDVARSL